MESKSERLTDSKKAPGPKELASWLGPAAMKYWRRMEQFIDTNYPRVFAPDWLYGGRKHGWTLRYKKGKSFCTFLPEKGLFALVIVFGAKERAGVEDIRDALSVRVRKEYDQAHTYHDGKWLRLNVNDDRTAKDAGTLLAVKRRPAMRGTETGCPKD